MKPRLRRHLIIALLILSCAVAIQITPKHVVQAGDNPVQRAWKKARRIGSYRYSTDITQTTWPLLVVENVGKAATEERIYIQGRTDLHEESMELRLWSGGGSAATGQESLEMRVEDGVALGRVGDGPWREIEDVTGLFAPGRDALSYLAGARDIEALGSDSRGTHSFTRYAFNINGAAFAEHVRAQMEAELQSTGKLPPGLGLKTINLYREMTGHGEVWLDADGLPIRQIIHATFPPTDREQVKAIITTDFSSWEEESASSSILSRVHLSDPSWRQIANDLGLILGFLSMMTLVLVRRNSRYVYTILVLLILISMLITPLLRAQRVRAFYDEQLAERAEYEREQEQSQTAREIRRQLTSVDFDPHTSPLESDEKTPFTTDDAIGSPKSLTIELQTEDDDSDLESTDSDGDGLTDAEEDGACTDPNLPDSDGDGLSDGTEMNELGTHPCEVDTDGDSISDITEVEGFELYGQQWYLDPLEPDTNLDTVADVLECYALTDIDANGALDAQKRQDIREGQVGCADTDGDGTPDVFDNDDDGDGVPDAVDLSRATVVGGGRDKDGNVVGLADQTFAFKIDAMTDTVGTPLFVDFQLRPTDPEHLWYSLSLLDWPSGDTEGQIQRYFDTTFRDYNETQGDSSGDKDDQGDMRLIPMVEIEIPYSNQDHYGNLPVVENPPALSASKPITAWLDMEAADRFNMTVRYKDESDDPALLVYVPATLVRDRTGNNPVAFAARVLYQPNSVDFGHTQDVRLVWLVEGLTDTCELPEDASPETTRETWCEDASHWQQNPPRILHSYYEDWYLTGLAVREDQGVKAGVVYEDADYAERDPDYERYLWQLAYNLDRTFVAGRTQGEGSNQTRDVTVEGVEDRFEGAIPDGDERLWGIPKDALRMETFTLSDQTLLATLPMTHTRRILDDAFTDTNGEPKVDAPTLLFVREEQYRSANLEGIAEGLLSDAVTTLSLDPQKVHREVLAGINWAPYRFDDTEGWQAYPIDEYWDQMGERYQDVFNDLVPHDDDLINTGRTIIAQNYYMALYNGSSGVVKMGDTFIDLSASGVDDTAIANEWQGAVSPPLKIVKQMIEGALEKVRALPRRLVYFGTTEEKLLGAIAGARQNLKKSWVDNIIDVDWGRRGDAGVGFAIGAAAGGVAAYVTFAVLSGAEGAEIAFYAIEAISFAMSVKGVIDVAADLFRKSAQGVFKQGVRQAIKSTKVSLREAGNIASIVGLIVTSLVSIGFFVAQIVSAGVRFGTLAFNLALAAVVAEILVSVIIMAIGMIPIVGQIIVAIVGLIDSIIGLICTITGLDERQDLTAPEIDLHPCDGISGAMAKVVQFLIYDQTPLVDLEREERLEVDFGVDLLDKFPHQGFVKGNQMAIRADVTTKLYKDFPIGIGTTYAWQFSDKNLKKSSFEYSFETFEENVHLTQGLNTGNPSTWSHADPPAKTDTIASDYIFAFSETGINQKISAYLNEGYAMKAQECYMVPNPVPPYTPPTIPICNLRNKTDTLHVDLDLRFDILPATVGAFRTLTSESNGYAPAWNENDDLVFPALEDADGDGLTSPAFGGNDPSDRTADADQDGLSDRYEVRWSSDPTLPDTDGDGLSDYDEWRHHTDPNHADTDHDGLQDGDEVSGWPFVYGFDRQNRPLETRVTSDPRNPDTDGDGLIDKLEQVYNLNPRVSGPATPLSIESVVDEDDTLAKPGDTIQYSATITNELRLPYARGLFDVTFPSAVQDESLEPQPFMLGPLGTTTMAGEITVSDVAPSEQLSLTNRAGAIIQNLRTGRQLWLHLNEAAGSTNFADASLLGHDATCTGGTCPTAGTDGYFIRAAEFDGNDDRLLSRVDLSEENHTLLLWFRSSCESCGIVSAVNTHNRRHDRDLFLKNGDLCAQLGRGSARETLCTSSINYADGAWHMVAHTFGGAQGAQRLYVDGAREATGQVSTSNLSGQDALYVGYAPAADQAYFEGQIDELEIFPRVLDEDEVTARFSEPVFHATFSASEASGYQDATSHRHQIDCATRFSQTGMTTLCPDSGEAGIIGKAASFDRQSYLTLSPSDDSLNLRRGDGTFTLSAWIYPTQQDNRWRGIFGHEDHDQPERSYPSLYAKGSERRFKAAFGNGTQICEVTSDYNALTRNTWQQVVATFDGTNFTLHVNGEEVGSDATCAGTRPYRGDTLDIGRASTAAHITFSELEVIDEGDGLDSDKWGRTAEYNLFVDGTRVWADPNILPGIYHPPGYTVYGDFAHSFSLTELDKTLEEPARGDDDLLLYELFYNYRPNSRTSPYDEDGEGTLTWNVGNEFYAGRLDDLRIYRRALSKYEIIELYEAATRILELRFDEPPGATTFQDHSGSGHTGICDGDACPATGLPGRANQALRFDGTDDGVTVNLDVPESDYGISLWFKSRAYNDGCEDCGLFSINGKDGRDGDLYLKNGKACARVQSEEICTANSNYADGAWHHLVHTVGAPHGGQTLTVDGQETVKGTLGQAEFGLETEIRIGASRAAGHPRFAGLIDHIVLTRKALAPGQINRLRQEIPVVNLHLDDPLGSSTFQNVVNSSLNAGCDEANNRCPGAGVDGWIYNAARFDGQNDALQIASHAALDLNRFSIGLWVYPTQKRSSRQAMLTRENWLGEPQNYALFIEPDSMQVHYEDCRQSLDSSPDALLEDQWNHLMVTRDADALTLYVNGAQDSVLTDTLAPCQQGTLYFGGDYATYWGTADALPFAGSLDEIAMYGRALSRPEVEELYNYQVSWYDIKDTHRILVDAEKPTVTALFTSTVVDMSPGRVIEIAAQDETTNVEAVQYRIDGGAWQQASQDGRVWMFPFTPTAEGPHAIEAQAIDTVGHRSPIERVTFVADGSPPVVGLDSASAQRVLSANTTFGEADIRAYETTFPATGDSYVDGWWQAGQTGIGLRYPSNADVINRVDYDLAIANEGYGDATLELAINETVVGTFTVQPGESQKQLSFSFPPMARTHGQFYQIWLHVVDGNNLKIPTDQSSLTLFAPQPTSRDQVALSGSAYDRGGAAVEAVWIDLIDQHGASLGGHQRAELNNDRWTIEYAVPTHTNGHYTVRLEAIDSVGNRTVREDERIRIDGTPPGADLTGAGDGTGLLTGIGPGAPILTGTVSDQPYPNGRRLHFHFEEPLGATTFHDSSGRAMDATCTGADCPTTENMGRFGAAVRFEAGESLNVEGGTNDMPLVAPIDYTLAAWIQSNRNGAPQTLLTATEPADPSRGFWLGMTADGKLYHTHRGTGGEETLFSSAALNDGKWHHITAVKEGILLALYVDGVRVSTATTETDLDDPLNVVMGGSFAGKLDELLFYERALTRDQVQALADPAASGIDRLEIGFRHAKGADLYESLRFHLAFEELAGADAFADIASGRPAGHCTGIACPETIEAGRFGRSLSFDGVDDEVRLGPVLLGGPLTLSAWVKPVSTQGTQTILHHGLGAENEQGNLFMRIRDGYYEVGERRLDGDYVARYPIPPEDVGRWVHLTGVTLPGPWSAWFLYRNGTFEASSESDAYPSYLPSQRVSLTIGSNGAGEAFFAGEIDEVAVYDRSLLVTQKGTPRLYDHAIQALADPDRWREVEIDRPGATLTPWHYRVEGIEGPYALDLRVVDAFGHAALAPNLWSGEIDTQAPRIKLQTWSSSYWTGTYTGTLQFYRCTSQDYNLTDKGIRCPGIAPSSLANHPLCLHRGYIESPWYTERFTQTKLQRLTTSCNSGIEEADGPQTAEACDAFGQCTILSVDPFAPSEQRVDPQSENALHAQSAPPIQTVILTPTNPSVVTTTNPVEIEGYAYAPNSLRTLTMTVNDVPTSILTWTVDTVTSTIWHTAWMPSAQGVYTLGVQAADWAGNVVTTTPISPQIYIDSAPPALNLITDTITQSGFSDTGYVGVRGWFSDTVGLARLQVRYGKRGWDDTRVPTTTQTFDAAVWTGSPIPPAGNWITLAARAIDYAGHTTEISQTVWIDAEAPAPVTATLTYVDPDGVRSVITPGMTIRDVASPLLRIAWTGSASEDTAVYRAGWTQTPIPTNLTAYPFTAREHLQNVGEAQKLYAHIIVEDGVGNRTIETLGPIYTDYTGTPAYLDSKEATTSYQGWLEDPCNLLGVDNRAAQDTEKGLSIDLTQRLYATWNTSVPTPSLHLAWIGADWSNQGDLFLYLDTQAGGTDTAYTRPYATYTDTQLLLPGSMPTTSAGGEPRAGNPGLPMEADAFIWVKDNTTAWLWRWNGTTWTADAQLPKTQYRFIRANNRGQTDLTLPLNLLGLSPGDALSLVAFAIEDPSTGAHDGLRLWATMPPANPVNSEDLIGPKETADTTQTFALSRAYTWPELSPDVCPNGQRIDTLPLVEVTAAPRGTVYRFLGDGLAHLWDPMFGAPPTDISEDLNFTDAEHPPLYHGQTIAYTLRYRNPGPDEAQNVRAVATAHYGLRLPGAPSDRQVIPLGTVAPGETVNATLSGEIQPSGVDWAALDILIYDDSHPESGPPVEWIWVDHRVDGEAPEFYGVRAPQYLVAAGPNTLRGYAYDRSGVSTLNLIMETPDAGTRFTSCTDPTPSDGAWLCDWDTTTTNGNRTPQDGDLFAVSLQATDRLGQTGSWTNPRPFLVDTLPPTFTLTLEEGQTLDAAQLVGDSAYALRGTVTDNHGLGHVEICEEGQCDEATLWLDPGPAPIHLNDSPDSPMIIDRSTPCINRTFVVTEAFSVSEVTLGLNITHAHRGDLRVALRSPAGTEVQVVKNTDDADQHYDVALNDAAAEALHPGYNDDPATPAYDRVARPDAPLGGFLGESATGTWTLTLCDEAPEQQDGAYNQARLILNPPNTAARAGRWYHKIFSDLSGEAYMKHEVAIYVVDLVGNRSQPLDLTVVMDSEAPSLTVTEWPSGSLQIGSPIRMSGTVNDPSGIQAIRLVGLDPQGETVGARIERQGSTWTYTDPSPFIRSGTYQLFVEAVDRVGNQRTVGPLALTFGPPSTPVYLPLVFRRYTPAIAAPDLVVTRIHTSEGDVALTLRNQGSEPAEESFWVDLYVDPDPLPVGVNQIWSDLSDKGMVWGVTDPLGPGEAITLTLGDRFYMETYSDPPQAFEPGMSVYAQIDSANTETDYGAVLETHEISGAPYNNIEGVRLTSALLDAARSMLRVIGGSSTIEQPAMKPPALPKRP